MTRFLISLDNGVNFVLSSLGLMNGGEIFVPKIPSVRIVDLAKLILPNHKIKIIGIRKGEKLDEVLISKDESSQLFESNDRYIIEPMLPFFKKKFDRRLNLKKVIKQFQYSSDLKPFLLEADQIQKNLDIKF